MLRRILSSVILIPPLLLLLLRTSSEWFFLLLLPVSGILLYEWHRMLADYSWVDFTVGVFMAWMLLANALLGFYLPTTLLVAVFLMIWFFFLMYRYREGQKVTGWVGSRLTGVVYCTLPLVLLLEIHQLGEGRWIVFLLFVMWGTDSGALFLGKWLGRRKFAVQISPNKTMAGFFGGLLFGVAGAALAVAWFSLPGSWIQMIGYGLVLSLAGQMGDLAESMVKREAGIKDSGRLIPGHGGLLDRLDSLLFAAPVLYLLIRVWVVRP